MSLTSIKANESILKHCINSLLNQTLKPDAIYLYLSRSSYLLDTGYSSVPNWLESLPVHVIFVENSGPFRKLLPLLKSKWTTDELIITVDDDTVYSPNLIETMVKTYKDSGSCICCRGYLLTNHDSYTLKSASGPSIYNFHTGKGAVLYSPSMFQRKAHSRIELGIFH